MPGSAREINPFPTTWYQTTETSRKGDVPLKFSSSVQDSPLNMVPQFVEPTQLEQFQTNSATPSTDKSIFLYPKTCLSLSASKETQYRPCRGSIEGKVAIDQSPPGEARKHTKSRITPRSDKHARELEMNRKAASKCRIRQKAFVDKLQERCREEEERWAYQKAEIQQLTEEVGMLRQLVITKLQDAGCTAPNGSEFGVVAANVTQMDRDSDVELW